MTGPLWLHAALASLMIVIAAGCAIRLVRGERRPSPRRPEFDADALHLLMGVAMVGLLLPQLRVLPAQVWEAVFAAAAIWFGWRALPARRFRSRPAESRRPPLTHHFGGAPFAHVIECLAMIFMLLPALDDAVGRSHPFSQAMAGMSRTGLVGVAPAVALLLALCLVGYVVWTTDALARTRSVATATTAGAPITAAGGLLAPRLAAFSKIAMTLTMGYMLIQMA